MLRDRCPRNGGCRCLFRCVAVHWKHVALDDAVIHLFAMIVLHSEPHVTHGAPVIAAMIVPHPPPHSALAIFCVDIIDRDGRWAAAIAAIASAPAPCHHATASAVSLWQQRTAPRATKGRRGRATVLGRLAASRQRHSRQVSSQWHHRSAADATRSCRQRPCNKAHQGPLHWHQPPWQPQRVAVPGASRAIRRRAGAQQQRHWQ